MVLFNGMLYGGIKNAILIDKCWDFALINQGYAHHLTVLVQMAKLKTTGGGSSTRFRDWLRREREAWLRAVEIAPLLPASLVPKGYLGQKDWRKCRQVLSKTTGLMVK